MNDIERRADGAPRQLEHLSALIDGEIEGDAADHCCAHWREQAEARRHWHAWHLIGDVLRSEELACGATRSAHFLEQVRGRLAAEPVVLAPARDAGAAVSPAAARTRRRSWLAPAAVAAGFMAVAVALVATRAPSPGDLAAADRSPVVATAGVSPAPVSAPGTALEPLAEAPAVPPVEPRFVVADGQLVRDSRLDRYLAAHKQFGGSSVLGVPSGFLRSATLQTPER